MTSSYQDVHLDGTEDGGNIHRFSAQVRQSPLSSRSKAVPLPSWEEVSQALQIRLYLWL